MKISVLVNKKTATLEGVFADPSAADAHKEELEASGEVVTHYLTRVQLVKTGEHEDHPAQKILDLCRALPGISLEDTDIEEWAEEILRRKSC